MCVQSELSEFVLDRFPGAPRFLAKSWQMANRGEEDPTFAECH